MSRQHNYSLRISWESKTGTDSYNSYLRDHLIQAPHKPVIYASSDPSFKGNASHYNPEELFIASIASCHMLWYLHLCTIHNIVVVKYEDDPKGIMIEQDNGSGMFTEVQLHPIVTILSKEKTAQAIWLHEEANKFCFIANSLNFAVMHQPKVIIKENNV